MPELLSDYITRDQLAQELRVTTRTLDKWAHLRTGPKKIKVGSRCFYRRSDILAWLDQKAQEAHA